MKKPETSLLFRLISGMEVLEAWALFFRLISGQEQTAVGEI
jgi:hypothetical protein